MCHCCSATRWTLLERRHVKGLNLHMTEVVKPASKSIMRCLKYFSHKSNVSFKCSVYGVLAAPYDVTHKKIQVPTHFHETALFSKEPIYLGDTTFIAPARPVRNFHLLYFFLLLLSHHLHWRQAQTKPPLDFVQILATPRWSLQAHRPRFCPFSAQLPGYSDHIFSCIKL